MAKTKQLKTPTSLLYEEQASSCFLDLGFFKLASCRFAAASWSFANGVTIGAGGASRGGGVTTNSLSYPLAKIERNFQL